MHGNAIHHNSRAVLRAWESISATRSSGSVQPLAAQFPNLANNLFVLRHVSSEKLQFRSCSQTMNRIMGLKLVGRHFQEIWDDSSKLIVEGANRAALDRYGPAILQGIGKSAAGHFVHYEMILAPLDRCDSLYPRLLGFYQLTGPECVLSGNLVTEHSLFNLHVPTRKAEQHKLHMVVTEDDRQKANDEKSKNS